MEPMLPLILLSCALVGVLLIQAGTRLFSAARSMPVGLSPTNVASIGRTIARRVEPGEAIGDWENEGGLVAIGSRRDAQRGTR
jgi:hypothetical protein